MIIDASYLILGRLASKVAKLAMKGEKIDIVNCEKIVITGRKEAILSHYKWKSDLGSRPTKGPFFPKVPDRFVRRVIRGMLPYKQEKGEKAFKRVMCYIGVPDSLKDKKFETFSDIDIRNNPTQTYVSVEEVCNYLKAK